MVGSQANQVCYFLYPYVKPPRKLWQIVLKVNPRNRVQGKFNEKELVILQQTDNDGMTFTVEEINVDCLVDGKHPIENIDFEIKDGEPEDEFQCSLSSLEDDDEI